MVADARSPERPARARPEPDAGPVEGEASDARLEAGLSADALTSDLSPLDPCVGSSAIPGVCPSRGIYPAGIVVELSSVVPGVGLHYTLDGTDPTAKSARYAAPIDVGPPADRGVVILKVRAAQGDLPIGQIVVHSYLFPGAVLGQSRAPAGFPASWGNAKTVPGDYEMDPRVVNAERASLLAGLRKLPSMSIVMAHDDLWGKQSGIYMNAAEDGPAWERPTSVELIFAEGVPGGPSHQFHCTIQMQGGSSRLPWNAPKLSLRLRFRKKHGLERLHDGSLLPDSVGRFNTLVVDAHQNLTWIHDAFDQQSKAIYVRDPLASDLQIAVGRNATHHRFVHLYLNGLYWGVYDLHERPDEDYGSDYLGGSPDDYDVLKHDRSDIVHGDVQAWDRLFATARAGLETDAALKALGQQLDVAAFIDYMLVQFYLGNRDWDRHNWYALRRRTEGAGFVFVPWDAEITLWDVNDDVTPIPEVRLAPGNTSVGKPRELYHALRRNSRFLAQLNERADQLFGPGGPLSPDRVKAAFSKRIDEVRPAIGLESARWGDFRRPAQPFRVTDFDAEAARLTRSFIPQRTAIVRRQVR